jgi:hypothetical protein
LGCLRADLLAFKIPGSTLAQDRVVPAFKPPFDIIHRIAQETKEAVSDPLEEIPALLTV